MAETGRYGVLVFKEAAGFFSFWGEETTYEAMAGRMRNQGYVHLYGIGGVMPSELDRIANTASGVVRMANADKGVDPLGELKKYNPKWEDLSRRQAKNGG